ncbi:MAG TPA: hypothetical protein VFX74_09315 [Candidatus Limnocylindria bacterium]|jgi:hypothetical protein|nr:hypothetical protein [Candidatus Limnocylindria bacterium]
MPTPHARLDAAVDTLLAGEPLRDGGLAEVARLVHAALGPIPPSFRFEDRLQRKLRGVSRIAWPQLSPGRLIAAGAVSSAAVGVTALAVWRTSRRQAAARPWHR